MKNYSIPKENRNTTYQILQATVIKTKRLDIFVAEAEVES
jgi:hypothetical protein